MNNGVVTQELEALVSLKVLDDRGVEHSVDVLIDTGFNGFLTLPNSLVNQLGLQWSSRSPGELADGSQTWFDVYRGTVFWNDKMMEIPVDSSDGGPLLGMSLMRGFKLTIDIVEGGDVRIVPL